MHSLCLKSEAFAGLFLSSSFTVVLRLNMYQTQAAMEKNKTLLDEVTIRICEKFQTLPPLTNTCSIYKVPDRLRLGNEGDYTPKVVSLGPFHHGKEELRTMEEHKYRYLWHFLNRRPEKPIPDRVSHYAHLIKKKEAELRSAYAESINLNSDEFVSMILVDTAFTVEVLLRLSPEFRDTRDRIFDKPYMINDILPDMILLENQLPFFIINDLYTTLSEGQPLPNNELSVMFTHKFPLIDELLVRFMHTLLDLDLEIDENMSLPIIEDFKHDATLGEHLVDLLRYVYIPPSATTTKKTRKKAIITTPSSVELCQAGFQFEVKKPTNLSKSCIDYDHSSRVLKITKLTVSRKTEVAVMNLLAFEQCHRIGITAYGNDFVAFLDCLIHSSKDVDLLMKHEIIDNKLADTSCAYTMIKKLGNATAMSSESFSFANICEDLNQYHKSRRSRVKATLNEWAISLRKNYFYSPWAIISVIAAFILLVLTFIQAVCSIMSM